MKQFLLFIILLSSYLTIHAQCESEEDFPLDRVAVYPSPFGVIPIEDGGTGIVDTAFIGEMFDLTFTVVFPDTFLDPVTNSLTVGDTLRIIPDSTRFVFDSVDIGGFPEGLAMTVSPDTMLGTSEGPAGCVRLFGTPTINVPPGDYTMFFGANSCVQNPAFTGCMFVEIPSFLIGITGEYKLTIADRTSPTLDVLNEDQNFLVAPNPFDDTVDISFDTNGLSGQYQLQISDLSGRQLYNKALEVTAQKLNISVETDTWPTGIYIFRLIGEQGQLFGRMIKQD